jgi:hypothetical protein
MKYILNLLLLIYLIGCVSYFKRKECEQVNWYEYGHQIAMSGKILESDKFLNDCRKAEADIGESKLDLGYKAGRDVYCTMDGIYNTGKNGHPFSYELCDHLSRQKVKSRHLEGLAVFCKPENAYSFAAKGGVYEKVCPEEKELIFLKEYNKGRKVFLDASIKSNEIEIVDLDKNILRLQSDKEFKMLRLSRLPLAPPVNQTLKPSDARLGVVDVYKQERERMQNELNSIQDHIRVLEDKSEKLKEEDRVMRQELLSL